MDNLGIAQNLNHRATVLEDKALVLNEVVSEILNSDWALEGWDDKDQAARHEARLAVMDQASHLYKQAGKLRRDAFEKVTNAE